MTSLNQQQRFFSDMEALQITEMKSIQPYSTRDEYIYAMKEDLAEWFNSMYASNLTAHNFIDQLKNGVLICEHANNVMREAAFKAFPFNLYDLQQAGIINTANLNVNKSLNNATTSKTVNQNMKPNGFRSNTPKPMGQSAFAGEYLMYNQEPKMIMIAYDNITNFIKWCRFIVRVKECLMFETEDLTLSKNEKNFILCLLEVARFGSKFGIRVPTIIQLEQEIEAEIEQDKTNSQLNQIKIEDLSVYPKSRFIEDKEPNKEYIKSLGQNDDDLAEHKMSPSPPPVLPKYNDSLELSHLNDEILTSSFSSISNSPSLDKLKSASSSSPPSPAHASSRSTSPDAKKPPSPPTSPPPPPQLEDTNANNSDFQFNLNCPSDVSSASTVSSLTSLTASINHDFVSRLPVKNSSISLEKNLSPGNLLITNNKIDLKPKLNKSIENLTETTKPNDTIIAQQQQQHQHQQQHHQVNLHKHVCTIANKCTCEKKFLVDKIGEGKYRIGNTKNIVFIRILKNHIMVRVGGGWDTLENYLDKHDPCRCASDLSISNTNNNNNYNTSNTTTSSTTITNTKRYNESEQSNNIILTPVKPSTVANTTNNSGNLNSANNSNSKGIIRVTTINCSSSSSSTTNSPTTRLATPTPDSSTQQQLVKSKSFLKSPNSYLTYEPDSSRAVDFTDAHLIIERDYQGKHQIGKILIPSSSTNQIVESLNNFNNNNNNNFSTNTNNNNLIINEEAEEMNRNLYFLNAFKHDDNSNNKKDNINNNNNNNNNSKTTQPSSSSSTFHFSDNSTRPPPLNSESIYSSSLISFANSTNKAESLIKTKMKKLINKIPKQQQHLLQQHSFLRKSASSTSHSDRSDVPTSPMLDYTHRVESPSGLLKFSRTNYLEQEQLNEFKLNTYDHQETPVYTETKLPPRILRKYQKERSNTELLVDNTIEKSDIDLSLDSPKMDDPLPHGPSSSSQNSETASSSSYQSSFIDSKTADLELDTLIARTTKQNSISPKLVVKSRTKLKKYKKSKTTDLSKYDEDDQMKTSDFETDSICGESNIHTDENNSSSSSSANNQENKLFLRLATPSPILKADLDNLNDSLELLPNDSKLEDDSLIINDTSTPVCNKNANEQHVVLSPMPTKSNRAQWDKSRQQIDLMYFNYSKLNSQQLKSKPASKLEAQPRSLSQAATQPTHSNTPNSNNNTINKNTKRVKNLNLAKEKLYEMKKTIDAKVNLNTLETKSTSQAQLTPLKSKLQPQLAQATQAKPTVPTTQTRTTPRKVKKRSGERSLTTGILSAENNNTLNKSNSKLNLGVKSTLLCASNTSINSVCTSVSTTTTANSYARIQSNNMKMRSRTPNHLSSTSLSKMNSKTTSTSLHNISNYDESMLATPASICNTSRNRHDSFSSTTSSFFNAPNADYKENKAYELRKKSTLMNKIITKTTQQADPIYTRSHPISTQLDVHKFEFPNVSLTGLGSYQTSAAARKRLFAKKNEQKQQQQQQQQQTFDPNVSIASNGSSSTSSSKINPSPVTRQSRPVTKAPAKKLTPRSKSNNDLYYELERTNSEQDLIELLNNYEAPAGDLKQYKIMLTECEKLQFHINKLKSQNNKVKSSKSTGQPQVKKSSTQVNVTPVASTAVVDTRRNALKKKSDLSRAKTLKDEVKDANEEISNNVNSNNANMTNSMHRRSLSLPSYIAIPLQEQNKNMQ